MRNSSFKGDKIVISENTKKNFFFIFLFSLIAMSLWLGEILLIKGWYGLNWLKGMLYSPFISTLFVVAAFMTSFVRDRSLAKRKSITAFVLLYIVSIFCYIAGAILVTLPYRMFFTNIYLFALLVFMLFIFFAACYWLITQTWVLKIKKRHFVYLFLLSIAVIPLSMISIWICPGFGTGDGEVDAIKMGYPVFWIGMMLGLAGLIMKE